MQKVNLKTFSPLRDLTKQKSKNMFANEENILEELLNKGSK